MIHADLPISALPAIRQTDVQYRGEIKSALGIFNSEAPDGDLASVIHLQTVSRQAGLVGYSRQIQCKSTENEDQQEGKMRDKAAVAAKAVFSENPAVTG